MGDIDVLVDKIHFRRAHQILLEHGYVFKFRSPLEELDLDSAEGSGGAEYSVFLPSGRNYSLSFSGGLLQVVDSSRSRAYCISTV